MHPRLLDIYASSFPDDNIPNGLGILSDAVSGFVEEEINGSYELEMEYPVGGINADKLGLFKLIYIPNDVSGIWQPFRIYKIEQRGQDIITVYARHLTYDLDGFIFTDYPYFYDTDTSYVSEILAEWRYEVTRSSGNPVQFDHVIRNYTFSCSSDKHITSGRLGNGEIAYKSIRSLFAGEAGSIVDLFGGEWYFNKWNSHWVNGQRGSDNGVTLQYGKNLTDCEIEISTLDAFSGIAPYYAPGDDVLIGYVNSGSYEEGQTPEGLPFDRTLPFDLASYFQNTDPENPPTTQQVFAKGQEVEANWGLGTVSQSIKVTGTTLLEQYGVVLGDTVHVVIPSLGIDQTTRLRKARWDFLNECYTDVEFGEATNRYKLATNDRFEVR